MFDWIFGWLDRFAQTFIWKSVLSHFQWIDWMALALVMIGVLYGLKSGMLAELGEILGAVIVIYLAHEYDQTLAGFIMNLANQAPEGPTLAISFILVASGSWFLLAFIANRFKKLFHAKTAVPVSVVGGAFLGGVHILILLALVCQGILLLSITPLTKAFQPGSSYSGEFFAHLTPRIHETIQGAIAAVKAKRP